ncbi:hypothetical protein EUTSA_v10015921mg [Eutrema salsugineum]|uniref:C2H2-type domain-containing protein n=1 Tax=Eutrema salsugineum TaxID=72664 RepID=V4NB00_EUTSA|nr:hypothetical protein EUTSA_v10015921mg [Eutrema salsugineum]
MSSSNSSSSSKPDQELKTIVASSNSSSSSKPDQKLQTVVASSNSSSSSKSDQELKTVIVAVEEKQEYPLPVPEVVLEGKITEVVPEGTIAEVVPEGTITEVVSERKNTERPSFGLGDARADPLPMENTLPLCNICNKRFPSANALFSHQISHKVGQELEKIDGQGVWKTPYSQGTSGLVFGGPSQGAPLSNDNIPYGIPLESVGGARSSVITTTFPSSNGRYTGGIIDMGMFMGYPVTPYRSCTRDTSYNYLSSDATRCGLSLGPCKYGGGGSSRDYSSLFNGGDTSYNYHSSSDATRCGISLGPFKYGGGGSSRDYPSLFNGGIPMAHPTGPNHCFNVDPSHASLSREPLPSNRYRPHGLSLSLTLGRPSDQEGSYSNNNSSYHGSLSLELPPGECKFAGVTGGRTEDLNMPVRPHVSRYQYKSCNPLDSITRNVPEAHPLPLPPSTNLSMDENVSGSSDPMEHSSAAEGKNKVGECEDHHEDSAGSN